MDIKKRHVTWDEIEGYVNHILFTMYKDNWKPDYIVGLTRGGLIPAVLASHKVDVPMHTLKVSLRDHQEHEANWWMEDDAREGKRILVIDDINDTGATINYIKENWTLNNLTYAVLINNEASDADVDYSSVDINKRENDVWIVFPWEDWWK